MKTGYGTIYQFEFDGTCAPFGSTLVKKCKVLILKKGYNATVFTIPYGQVSPVEIDYPTANDDIFYPIKGSSLSFKVLGGVINMDSIISEDEQEYFLEYYRGNNIFWSGYVSPELCEEDIFLRYPAIEFKTIDALGSLNSITFKDNDGLKSFGKRSIKSMINSVFNGLGFDYKFNILSKVWAETMSTASNALSQVYVYLNVYRDRNGMQLSTSDLLKSFAYLFNSIIYQDNGQWWFVRLKDLAFGQFATDSYNKDGSSATSQSIPVLVHGTNFLITATPRRKIRRFYREASVKYNYVSFFSNLDTNFTVFDNDNTAPNNVKIYNVVSTFDETPNSNVNGVDIYERLTFNIIRAGNNSPSFKFFTEFNSPNLFSYFDSRINDYGLVITAANSTEAQAKHLEYVVGNLSVGETFSLSISSISKNIVLQIIVDGKYYNATTDTWGTTPLSNGGLGLTSLVVENIASPYAGEFKIRLFPQIGYIPINIVGASVTTAFATAYHGFYVSKQNYNDYELTTVTNIKNTSIIPETVNVYNGDKIVSDGGLNDIIDWSNLFLNDDTKTTTWFERSETNGYKIQELAARNILNQYSDYRNIFTGTIIGENIRYGAIYRFPNQGALASRDFFPLSMKMNERDCTAEVIFMELTSNEIDPTINQSVYDNEGNIVLQNITSSKKKNRNGVGTDLGEAGDFGTIFDRFVAFFMDDFKP